MDLAFFMHKITAFFNQHHPAHTNPIAYLRVISIISILVFFILYIFRPFDWAFIADAQLFIAALVSSGATFLGLLLLYLWFWLFPHFFDEKNWSLGKELLLIIYQFTVVSAFIWLARHFFGHYWGLPQRSYAFTWWTVCITGIIPYLLATSVKHIFHFRKYIRQAILINNNLPNNDVTLSGELYLTKSFDSLRIVGFLFMEAHGNYVTVHCIEGVGNQLKQHNIRCTLAQVETNNKENLILFRCHRAFIINLNSILQVDGNAAGYQLTLHPDLPQVPVSRSYANEFKERLASNFCHSSQISAKYP
ncbi:LytTR family DNA-binding domain-containing protein [Pedobacter endophyticus]|uniref:LytTR family transcriptional regulator n=1 Tax=Pedobacter endophyticus TaxID=2789740 RepID=A0A7S9L0C4_9SPHI|nr:LytTR family DNA-binding domain-containing protein [Pedobacter endophyticus]QPH40155.1 LytTR family transcriptional regulator [Pedobacter endophyticus]